MIKRWIVTAELDMDASDYESVIVAANTSRKALAIAEKKFKDAGHFFVTNMSVKEFMNTEV